MHFRDCASSARHRFRGRVVRGRECGAPGTAKGRDFQVFEDGCIGVKMAWLEFEHAPNLVKSITSRESAAAEAVNGKSSMINKLDWYKIQFVCDSARSFGGISRSSSANLSVGHCGPSGIVDPAAAPTPIQHDSSMSSARIGGRTGAGCTGSNPVLRTCSMINLAPASPLSS